MKYFLFLVIAFTVFFVRQVRGEVFINEFTPNSSPQKVEIINISSSSADISNWYIDDAGGTTYFTIPPDTLLYPNSCKVFEGNFNFNKTTSDSVRLFNEKAPPTDPLSVLIDSFSYSSSPGLDLSFARNPDGNGVWISGPSSIGYFNGTAVSCLISPTPTPTPIPSFPPTLSPASSSSDIETPSSPPPVPVAGSIIVNELYPYPDVNENEWVELYNNSDIDADIRNWYVDDVENGGSTPKRFSMLLPAHGYRIIEYTSYLFNNDADTVRLLDQDKNEVDGFEYSHPQKNKSVGRDKSHPEIICVQNPSKETGNYGCLISPFSQNQSIKSDVLTVSVSPSYISTPLNHSAKPVSQSLSSAFVSQSEVLGASTVKPEKKPVLELQSAVPERRLAFASISYSILTIISLLIKIRNGLAA